MKLVVKGTSLYLPSQSRAITPSHPSWRSLYSGEHFITPISDEERDALLQKNQLIEHPSLKGKELSPLNLNQMYKIPSYISESCDEVGWYAIACGIEALIDSGISIYSSHFKLKGLDPLLQHSTGVICVGMFPSLLSITDKDSQQHKLYLQRLIVRPNAHLSQLIKAKGPSVFIDTACSSTMTAISMAEDWLRLGHCDRVVIIGSDNPTNEKIFPLICSGFHKLGVLTSKSNINEASCPFDSKRSGFIIGSSAFGMVIEKQDHCTLGNVELISSIVGNSGFLTLSLDEEYMAMRLDSLIKRVCSTLKKTIEEVSHSLIYVAHETSTPRCAPSEIWALRHVFKSFISNIIICGLKGFLGHSLSTNYEEVFAVDILKRKQVPPTFNLDKADPLLGNDLTFSKGETHSRLYILRFSAGFGSSIGYSFYQIHV